MFRWFLERQPQLALQNNDCTAVVRMDTMKNQIAIDNYFMELKRILHDNELGGKPRQSYNMDKSGVPLNHCSPHILARRGQKNSGIIQLVKNLRLLLLIA